ncbi:MAG: GNAT family N-acetyltransferase [Pseudomonadota bacterium]|nr:GNAT family N-acetyltransferase [Pseudomonadota bacterium]
MNDWKTPPVLSGLRVRLEPLQPQHASALGEAAADGELWRLGYTSVPSAETAAGYIDKALSQQSAGHALPFVVMDSDGIVVGSTRFYGLDPEVPRVQIGYTWYARRAQRTGLNTEAKRLLLAHAFEHLQCACVGFETSAFNHASRTAIAGIGAKLDGVLRSHMRHPDGSLRDTVAFSIIRSEWPWVRQHLQAKLERHAHAL